MEAHNIFSKSSIFKFRISRTLLMIIKFVAILGCFQWGGIHLHFLFYMGAVLFGFLIGMFSKAVTRHFDLIITIPASVYFGVVIFRSIEEDLNTKMIFLTLIIFIIIVSETIENLLFRKLRRGNTN